MVPSRFTMVSIRRAFRAAALVALSLVSAPLPAWSQPGAASLSVTVVDQTGAVVAGATVTVTGTDDATKTAGPATATASKDGTGTVPNLAPGRYTIGLRLKAMGDLLDRLDDAGSIEVVDADFHNSGKAVTEGSQMALMPYSWEAQTGPNPFPELQPAAVPRRPEEAGP